LTLDNLRAPASGQDVRCGGTPAEARERHAQRIGRAYGERSYRGTRRRPCARSLQNRPVVSWSAWSRRVSWKCTASERGRGTAARN